MAITRWQPGHSVLSMRNAFDRLFDESVWWPTRFGNESGYGAFAVPMDVYTDGESYVVEAALPGVKPEEIDVQMVGSMLTISGEVKLEAPEGRQYLARGRSYGRFQTSITLPDAADASAVKASFEHGVLKLEVPKSEAAKPKRIALTAGK